nr:hypothetical protein [Candidatus Sigynarchaeota archaeon]
MKKDVHKQVPGLRTERYLLVKIDGNAQAVKDILASYGIIFDEIEVHSMPVE